MKTKSLKALVLLHLAVTGCSSLPSKEAENRTPSAAIDQLAFFYTPENMHETWLKTIGNAKTSILMEMFHLTDPAIMQALRDLSSTVSINLVLDSGNLKDASTAQIAIDITAD